MSSASVPKRFQFLENLQNNSKVKIRITFTNLNHHEYGCAENLWCDLPILLPAGQYPVSNYYKLSPKEQDLILEEFVRRHRSLHEELDDEEIRKKFLGWLIITVTVFSSLDVYSETFKSVCGICAASFQIDDTLDDGEDELKAYEVDLSLTSLYKRYHIWEQIFDGEYEAWESIARANPVMATAIKFYIDAFTVFCREVAGFRTKIIPFQRAVFRGSEAVHLLYELRLKSEEFSEEAIKKIREADAGGQLFLEASVALGGFSLPDCVRGSLIFKIFVNQYNAFTGFLNDIFGIQKDLKNNSAHHSSILRRVENGVSLEAAFYETAKLLELAAHDVRCAGWLLLKNFGHETSVQEFVKIGYRTFDGQIYAYLMLILLENRYGGAKFEILQDDN